MGADIVDGQVFAIGKKEGDHPAVDRITPPFTGRNLADLGNRKEFGFGRDVQFKILQGQRNGKRFKKAERQKVSRVDRTRDRGFKAGRD